MRAPVLMLFLLLITAFPAFAQEEQAASADTHTTYEKKLDFSHSLMFNQNALDKFMELYEVYQSSRGSGGETFVDTSVNLDIRSEVQPELDSEEVILTLNSVLWDKGKWTIWVNGSKYEMGKDTINLGAAAFYIVAVGRENVIFVYQPSLQNRSLAATRYKNRKENAKGFKAVLVKGEDVSSLNEGDYTFTLRPNQSFRAEAMVLTEGTGPVPRVASEPIVIDGVGDGAVPEATPSPAPVAGQNDSPLPPALVFPERELE